MSDVTHQQTPTPRPRGPDAVDPSRDLWSLWRSGRRPRVADFLEQAGVHDPEQIVMALRVDQAERCRLGQWVPAESYFDAFPAIKDDAESAIDLIFAEYLLREEAGRAAAPGGVPGPLPPACRRAEAPGRAAPCVRGRRRAGPVRPGKPGHVARGEPPRVGRPARGFSRGPGLRGAGGAGPGRHGGRLPRLADRAASARSP